MLKIEITDETGNSLYVDNQYKNYMIDLSLEWIADSFQATLVNPGITIKPGYWFIASENGTIFFEGIITGTSRTVNKQGTEYTISGSSKVVLLTEAYCTTWMDENSGFRPDLVTPYDLFKAVLRQSQLFGQPEAPSFSNTVSIGAEDAEAVVKADNAKIVTNYEWIPAVSYSDEFKAYQGAINPDDGKVIPLPFSVRPGHLIWDKLKEILVESGFDAWYQNNTLYVGNLIKSRAALTPFMLSEEDIIEQVLRIDENSSYSSIVITSTAPYNWGIHDTETYVSAGSESLSNIHRVKIEDVGETNTDKVLEKELWDQHIDMWQLEVKVQGHVSSNGTPWVPNRIIKVDTVDYRNLSLIIKSVKFNFDRQDGSTTTLSIVQA